jgi:hypothetical protein
MRSILKFSLLPAVLAATLGGCLADGSAGMTATVATQPAYVEPAPEAQVEVVETPYVEPASYVYVSPDVEVIADYDQPVFFSGGFYYRYENNVWYSSSYHDRGWSESREVPEHIRGIDHPTTGYVNVHANVSARPGEVGYVRSKDQVHIVHSAPPPKYVEHPPAQRGGTNYRPPAHAVTGNGYQPASGHTNPEHGYTPPEHAEPGHAGYQPPAGVHEQPKEPIKEGSPGYGKEGGEGYKPPAGVHEQPKEPIKEGSPGYGKEGGEGYKPPAGVHEQPKAPVHESEPTHSYTPAHNTTPPKSAPPKKTYTPPKKK